MLNSGCSARKSRVTDHMMQVLVTNASKTKLRRGHCVTIPRVSLNQGRQVTWPIELKLFFVTLSPQTVMESVRLFKWSQSF